MRLEWQRGVGGNSNSLPFLVFLLSVSATICAWVWSGVIVKGTDQERFNYATEEAEQAIQGRLDDQVDLLRATAATFAFQRSWPHTHFKSYVSHLDLSTNYRGLQGIGFIQVVSPSRLTKFEASMHGEGFTSFKVHPVISGRDLYPIVYLEPANSFGANSIGFDAYGDANLRGAMEDAMESASPILSGIEPVLQATARPAKETGFMLFYPVYRGGEAPETVSDRRNSIIGFVFCPLKGSGLYQNVLEGEARRYLDVGIYDLPKGGPMQLVYSSSRYRPNRLSAIMVDATMPTLGRQWILRFSTSGVFEEESATWLVRWILVSGLLVSFLLTAVSYTQVSANRLLSHQAKELAERGAEVVRLNENLEHLVHDRTTELRASNMELEAFCYSVSHDLRAPLRSVDGFSKSLLEDYGEQLDEQAVDYLNRVRSASKRMDELISALLNLSRITRLEIVRQPVDITQEAIDAAAEAFEPYPEVRFALQVEPGLTADGDPKLVRVLLDNLIGNAVKFSSTSKQPRIEIGKSDGAFFVRDNGVGFNPAYSDKLFAAFERLHTQNEFPGSGIGLATVQRIVQRHGGAVWAISGVGKGATFYFTLR
ncbi:MAG: CHASE domain-containing protein [Fimbriimonas sp.]|nr:CHASE domain-containing protein [Fimbriimonas sp.]